MCRCSGGTGHFLFSVCMSATVLIVPGSLKTDFKNKKKQVKFEVTLSASNSILQSSPIPPLRRPPPNMFLLGYVYIVFFNESLYSQFPIPPFFRLPDSSGMEGGGGVDCI